MDKHLSFHIVLKYLMVNIQCIQPKYRDPETWHMLHENTPSHNSYYDQVCVFNHLSYYSDMVLYNFTIEIKIRKDLLVALSD